MGSVDVEAYGPYEAVVAGCDGESDEPPLIPGESAVVVIMVFLAVVIARGIGM